jgi:undecaprenyl diphosphate synthase
MKLNHLAIIPDGNRRWAKAQGLPSLEGHRRGYDNIKDIGTWAIERGIKHLSVWGFSTENWNRTVEEVGYLMKLIELALTKELKHYKLHGIRVRVIGSRERLPEHVLCAINLVETETEENDKGNLYLCINYGGQAEIIEATKRLIEAGVSPEEVTAERITKETWLADVPPVDLIIRTSGEYRLSGFMSWSGGYGELLFLDKHFPDFDESDMDDAIETFKKRKRRFGA